MHRYAARARLPQPSTLPGYRFGVKRHVPFILAPILVLMVACGAPGDSPEQVSVACGWDLTSQAGRDANQDRLTFINQWLIENPGAPAPEPTSSYWHGECPMPTAPVLPPDHEDEAPSD